MKSVILVAVVLLSVSCSTKKHKAEIKQQVEQSQVKDSATLAVTIDDAIANSKTISAEEKQKLQDLLAANKQKAMALTEESYKMRGVLIEELLSGKMSQKKVKIIKKNIKRIEGEKLKNTFDTVDQITKIVSKYDDRGVYAQPLMILDRPIR